MDSASTAVPEAAAEEAQLEVLNDLAEEAVDAKGTSEATLEGTTGPVGGAAGRRRNDKIDICDAPAVFPHESAFTNTIVAVRVKSEFS